LRHREFSFLSAAALAVVAIFVFTSCETAKVSTARLPTYEPPIARSDFQQVRTTAYTHTESDHRQYGSRNALGGKLRAASPGIRRAENARGLSADVVQQLGYPDAPEQWSDNDGITIALQSGAKTKGARAAKSSKKPAKRTKAKSRKPPTIGSAAADWSRWPAGTTFRLLSTGQMYRVEDYGWALAGRNTIDLYMPNRSAMNSWGTRREPIQILHWGNPDDSLKVLLPRTRYKHVRRMVLELQGQHEQAAAME
jgi:3D (Asp-Asp-Asp) domain-containing protein